MLGFNIFQSDSIFYLVWKSHLNFCILEDPVDVQINMNIRSLGPISEMDMVRIYLSFL